MYPMNSPKNSSKNNKKCHRWRDGSYIKPGLFMQQKNGDK